MGLFEHRRLSNVRAIISSKRGLISVTGLRERSNNFFLVHSFKLSRVLRAEDDGGRRMATAKAIMRSRPVGWDMADI